MPTALAPMSLDNKGANGEDASQQKPRGSGPMSWQYQVRARSPRSAQVTCGMWARQLLPVYGFCTKIDDQLNGMTRSCELRAELSQVKENWRLAASSGLPCRLPRRQRLWPNWLTGSGPWCCSPAACRPKRRPCFANRRRRRARRTSLVKATLLQELGGVAAADGGA